MKLLYQFGVIMTVTFLGEILHGLIPLPIPASIYGLLLMLAALCTGVGPPGKSKNCRRFSSGDHASYVYSGRGRTADCMGRLKSDSGSGSGHHSGDYRSGNGCDRKDCTDCDPERKRR